MELDLEFFKSLLSDFDLLALLPEMALIMEWITTAVQILVVAGPIVLIFMGLLYALLPAKEANHFVGYRFFWGMGSVQSWRFTQRFAGVVWAILGGVLAFLMFEERDGFSNMQTLDVLYRAVELLIMQIFWVFVSCVFINLVVFIAYSYKGRLRKLWRNIRDDILDFIDERKAAAAEKKK